MGHKDKKHKEKDRDLDEVKKDKHDKRSKKHKREYSSPESGEVPEASNSHRKKNKSKKKRKSTGSGGEDSDAPVSKSSKYDEKDKSARSSRSKKDEREHKKTSSPPADDSSLTTIDTSNRWREKIGIKPITSSSSEKKRKEIPRSPSPIMSKSAGGDASLSIEETNKLRLKLGLKPLQVGSKQPPSKSKTSAIPTEEEENEADFDEETLQRIRAEREKEAETLLAEEVVKKDFVHAPAENISEKKRAEIMREKIHNQREKRRIEEKLASTKGLADSDSDDDATKWVEKSKKIAEQKALAEKRAKVLEELDDEFGVGNLVESEFQNAKNKAYGDKDLKGLKVMHDHNRIVEGESVIMTLEDKGVLDEKDDVLVNVNMIDDEKFEKNVKERNIRPELHGYNVFNELGGFDEHGLPMEKKVLSKYDEEIGGVEKKAFVIGEDNTDELRRAKVVEKMQKANKILETIKAPQMSLASDFFSHDEMTSFKKRTKKVRKVRKNLRADDLLKDHVDGVRKSDLGSRSKKEPKTDELDVKIKSEPIDMDIDVRIEIDDLPQPPEIDISDIKIEDEGDLDFQLALSKVRKVRQKQNIAKPNVEKIAELIKRDEDADLEGTGNFMLHATAEFCRTLGDIPSYADDDIYGDDKMDFETEEQQNHSREEEERGKWNAVEIDETPVDVAREEEVEKVTILDQEPEIGSGVAGALKLAMKKGYLEQEKRKASAVSSMKHLQAKNYSIEDKTHEDDRAYSKRDMYSGSVSDFKEKSNYKPDFKLEYNDDDGRKITPKEAFRLLSHRFHGKGSGKNKIDKKRRKFEQDKLMQQMNSTDTPLNTLELLQERQKSSHSAYIVLTGSKAGQSSALSKSSKH